MMSRYIPTSKRDYTPYIDDYFDFLIKSMYAIFRFDFKSSVKGTKNNLDAEICSFLVRICDSSGHYA